MRSARCSSPPSPSRRPSGARRRTPAPGGAAPTPGRVGHPFPT
jgi:hypothetical protein